MGKNFLKDDSASCIGITLTMVPPSSNEAAGKRAADGAADDAADDADESAADDACNDAANDVADETADIAADDAARSDANARPTASSPAAPEPPMAPLAVASGGIADWDDPEDEAGVELCWEAHQVGPGFFTRF